MVNSFKSLKKSHGVALFLIGMMTLSCHSHRATVVSASKADSNDVSLQMMQQAAGEREGNIWLSPLSVSLALRTVAFGADGKTLDELQKVCVTGDVQSSSQLKIADAVWVESGYPVLDSYTKTCREQGAEVYNEDITAARVNAWAKEKTNGKISKILTDPVRKDMKILIANAIYFKADWTKPFKKNQTRKQLFYPTVEDEYQVDMMSQTDHFMYLKTDDFAMVTLPYEPSEDGKAYAMTVMLPKENMSASQLLQQLTSLRLKEYQQQAAYARVHLSIPRVKMDYEMLLNHTLQQMGVREAFSDHANFKKMAKQPLYIGMVKQNSYLDMNEKGTEAAAVTSVQMRMMAIPTEEQPIEMLVNRPYLLLLTEVESGQIIFLGRIEKP